MTIAETYKLFENMMSVFQLTEAQKAFTEKEWSETVESWTFIFQDKNALCVWFAVCRYAREGGRWWPFPGQIFERLPASAIVPDSFDYETLSESQKHEIQKEKFIWRYGDDMY